LSRWVLNGTPDFETNWFSPLRFSDAKSSATKAATAIS
jgi:hypothetical protein